MGTQAIPEPTDEQTELVELPAAARTLVTATAGTGKTYLLAHRIQALLATGNIGPGQILVLSFSRAATTAIRMHATTSRDIANVNIQTIDSFATKILASEARDEAWQTLTYDRRISAAINLLQEHPDAVRRTMGELRHILIDEIQDLTGGRVELAIRLLAQSRCGFTLFGDPAQAIYDFQVKRDDPGSDRATCFERVRAEFGEVLQERTLTLNFRAQSTMTRGILQFAPRLQSKRDDYSSIRTDLVSFLLTLPPVTELANARPLLTRHGGRTAVLCRNNGQALLISRQLFDSNIEHRLQRSATERVSPGWLAEVFYGAVRSRVTKEEICARFSEVLNYDAVKSQANWALLKSCDRRWTSELDCRIIANLLRTESLPDEFYTEAESLLIVSTVHRAKGLEFDRVLISVDAEGSRPDEDDEEECRILFVGLTRARLELYRLKAMVTNGMRSTTGPRPRWIRATFRGGARFTDGMEIRGGDIDATVPAGASLTDTWNVRATQEYIRTNVKVGDSVHFELGEMAQNAASPVYKLLHSGQTVGVSSKSFADLLIRQVGVQSNRWPVQIRGLNVEAIDSVAGNELDSAAFGLGCSGIWSRVRPFGLGEFT